MFYISFAGLGLGLVTAGLDYNTASTQPKQVSHIYVYFDLRSASTGLDFRFLASVNCRRRGSVASFLVWIHIAALSQNRVTSLISCFLTSPMKLIPIVLIVTSTRLTTVGLSTECGLSDGQPTEIFQLTKN